MNEYERHISNPRMAGLAGLWLLLSLLLRVGPFSPPASGPGTGLLVWSIDVAVLFGVLVVLPLALGGRSWPWATAATGAAWAFTLPTGAMAAALAAPWLVVCLVVAVSRIRHLPPLLFWGPTDVVAVAAPAYACVAAAALVQSRAGVSLFGVGEPFVELTAVHFVFAGTASLVLAGAAWTGSTGRWRGLAGAAVALVVVAPPVVALGFVTRSALPQVGGAVLMTGGVWVIAVLHVRAAADRARPTMGRVLLGLSGLAVWAPMVLAVSWAAARYWATPALAIPAMIQSHGTANAVGFVVCGLLGRRVAAASDRAARPAEVSA